MTSGDSSSRWKEGCGMRDREWAILEAASRVTGIPVEEVLTTSTRTPEAFRARELFAVACRNTLGMSYPDIKRAAGTPTHSTWHRAVQRWEEHPNELREDLALAMLNEGVDLAPMAARARNFNLTLPYPPSANRYWRHNRGRNHISREAMGYIAQVKEVARGHPRSFPVDPHTVCLAAYAPDARRRDIDNIIKVPLDALTRAGVWDDDHLVRQVTAFWADIDRDDPRLLVTIKTKVPA